MAFLTVIFAFGLFIKALLIGQTSADDVAQASCVIQPHSGIGAVYGNITLKQSGSIVVLNVSLAGFNLTSEATKHGFHVHESGDLSRNCSACLGHFNPNKVVHGNINDSIRHVGDLGNIVVKPDGTAQTVMQDTLISLHPDSPSSVIGRGIVVHEFEDDLGKGNATLSNSTGNAGGRLGCCTIVAITSRSSVALSSFCMSALLSLLACFLFVLY